MTNVTSTNARDKRSKMNLFLSEIEWLDCRSQVTEYVEKGYGLQLVPMPEDEPEKESLMPYYELLAKEMIHRNHKVIFLVRRENERFRVFAEKVVPVEQIKEC